MTSAFADPAGEIRVLLTPAEGRVGRVEIVSTRPRHAARIFVGRPVAEVTGMIGRVFSLCGRAQTVAALRAAEAALGIASAPGVEAARDLIRQAEMFTQVAMRLALHWPRVLGLPLRPDLVRAALAAERTLEAGLLGPGWRRPGAGLEEGGKAAAEAALAALEAAFAGTDLLTGLKDTLAARGIEAYGALPEGQGPEQGGLARHWAAPAVAAARARYGAGLAARLAAAGEELQSLPVAMRAALDQVAPAEPRALARDEGRGEAIVETARGPLLLRMEIAGGIVTHCETEAPTEANFSATGSVAAGLQGAPLDRLAAELHVLAIDPCVACSVEFDGV